MAGVKGDRGLFFNGHALGWHQSCPLSEETSWPHKHTSQPRTTAILAQQTSPGPQPALNTGSEVRAHPSPTLSPKSLPPPPGLRLSETVWSQCCVISSCWHLHAGPAAPAA